MAWNDVGAVIDDFNRASLGGDWSTPLFPGDGAVSIVDNELVNTAGWNSGYWNVSDYGPDLEASVSMGSDVTGTGAEIAARVQSPNSTNLDGYLAHSDGTNAQVWRIDNNAQTQIGSTGTLSTALATGDKIGLQCIGSSIQMHVFQSGAWTAWVVATDSTYSAAGKVGIALNSLFVDNLKVGNYASPYPKVETFAESADSSAGTSHTVTLPSGIQAGDLLLVILGKGSTAATINALTGWTELLDENVATGFYIAVRQADGTEGASISLTSSASTRCATIAYRISNAADPAVQLPEIGTTSTGSSTTPDPPNVNVTGGTKDILAIAALTRGGEEADDDTWATGQPSGYPGPTRQKAAGTVGTNLAGMVATAERQVTASSENPGTFTIATGAWRAQTIVVHPPAAAAFVRYRPTRALQAVGRGCTR